MSPRPRAHKRSASAAPTVDFLGLPGWVTTDEVDYSDPRVIKVPAQVLSEPESGCDRCGSLPYMLAPNGTRRQIIMDEPRGGMPVKIEIRRQAYQCKICKKAGRQAKTCLQPLPHVDTKRQITIRLRDYIRKVAAQETNIKVARTVGLDSTIIADIFDDYVKELESTVRFETPEWLGIDEVFLCGETYCVITNIKERTIYDILPDREKETVIEYLRKLPDPERVQLVTMDMWNDYRMAVHKALPYAAIVADKFHVMRMVKRVVDKVRIRVGETLSREEKVLLRNAFTPDVRASRRELLSRLPELRFAEGAMHRFRGIWQSDNPVMALQHSEAWMERIPKEVARDFRGMVQQMRKWEREIFAYFNPEFITEKHRRATNAYAEAVNGIIRNKFRMGRNLSFKSLRAKVLYAPRIMDGGRTSVRSTSNRKAETIRALLQQREEIVKSGLRYGKPISTFVDELTGGRSLNLKKGLQHDSPQSRSTTFQEVLESGDWRPKRHIP